MTALYKWLSISMLAALVAGGLWQISTQHQLTKARTEAAVARADADGYRAIAATQKAAYEAAVALHARETKVLTDRAKLAEQQARDQKEQSRVLAEALRTNSSWADSPIPDSVRNALKPAHSR